MALPFFEVNTFFFRYLPVQLYSQLPLRVSRMTLAEVRNPFYVLFQSNAPVLSYLIASCKVVP